MRLPGPFFNESDGSQRPPTDAELLAVLPKLAPKPFVYDFDLVRVPLREVLTAEEAPPYPHPDLTYLRGEIDPMTIAVWEAAEHAYGHLE
jgi:hypothetical protein